MKKIPVYSSISQCLFKYYTGKWLKFEILQYNQVPIFFSSIFQYEWPPCRYIGCPLFGGFTVQRFQTSVIVRDARRHCNKETKNFFQRNHIFSNIPINNKV